MATNAPAELVYLSNEWEKLYGSAVLSGIIGDAAHAARGGYHISIKDQPATNYSVIRPDDKAPPGTWPRDMASAVDMTLNLADMKVCHGRLREVWKNRANDPRIKYINAWNGWDGNGSPGRYDVVTGSVSTASDDHKWHVHLEIRRRYVNDRAAMNAILSILKGETLEQFLGEDMPTAQEVAKAVWDYQLTRPEDSTKSISAGTYQRYNDVVNNNAAQRVIDALKPLIGTVDVSALASNTAFVDALATAVALKVSAGVDVKAAVKEVLNGTKLTAA